MMKIVRITTSNQGGAGLCVHRLHRALVESGYDDKVFIADGEINDESTYRISKDKNLIKKRLGLRRFYNLLIKLNLAAKIDCYKYQLSRIKGSRSVFCTLPFSEYKGLRNLVDQEDADIINLHWIANFVDFPTFFKNVRKPIVWTLHDENPARGCLHYNTEEEAIKQFDEKVKRYKIKALKDVQRMYIVVQSQYMKDVCAKSLVLNRFPITIIPNGVNPNDFKMVDKTEARLKLGIPVNKQVYFFTSVMLEDKRKGLSTLIQALERFKDDNIVLICVGSYKTKPISRTIDIRCCGFVSDYNYYSLLYSAASFFVLPSLYESFAKTPLESMSCGTPVIAFPCSGTNECINDLTGVICRDFTVDALFEGLEEANKRHFDYSAIRNFVIERFTFELMAKRYSNLYNDILKCQ